MGQVDQIIDEIINILQPLMSTERERQVWLDLLFMGEKSKPDIDCAGAPRQATRIIVLGLIKFGRNSQDQYVLWRLLDLVAIEVGVDIQERIAKLKSFDLEKLRAEAGEPIRAFHSVPALPPYFLSRPDVLDALWKLVIDDVDKHITVIEGMGGIGKSVLATAFAHDPKVRFAFPDGIVWLTVGRDAKMYELYRSVGTALGDDLSNYPDETTARQNAQKALGDKKCLLILDDVWELPVGRAFRDLISGTVTRLLITTRNLKINDLLNANEYRLKLIDKSQAVDYLRSWTGNDPKLDEIAEKLGYLFLALKLAGARMKKDDLSGADYLRTFDRVSRMKIDRNPTDRDDSLEVSITLSVDAAFAGNEDDRLLYHTFGIFQEDSAIPQQTILQLWRYLRPDVDEFVLLETLNALVDLALVERHDDRTITLHDLLHRYTREQLGDRYVQTHQDLLEANRATGKPNMWHTVVNDGYIFDHLVYHLEHTGRYLEVHELFCSEGWTETRSAHSIVGLLSDFDRAIQLPIPADRPELRVRYSFFKEVIDELYKEVPVTAIFELLENGLIAKDLIVSSAKSMEGSTKLQKFLEILQFPSLTLSQRDDCAQQIVSMMGASDHEALQILRKFAPSYYDSGQRKIWQSVFERGREGSHFSREEKVRLLDELFQTSFSEQQYAKFKEDALKLSDINDRICMLKYIDSYLEAQEREEIWGAILDKIMSMGHWLKEYNKREAFSDILPLLQAQHLSRIPIDFWVEILSAPLSSSLLRFIPQEFIPEVWRRRSFYHPDDVEPFMIAIAPRLPDELLSELEQKLDSIRSVGGYPYQIHLEMILIQRNKKLSRQERESILIGIMRKHLWNDDWFAHLLPLLPDQNQTLLTLWHTGLSYLDEQYMESGERISSAYYRYLRSNLKLILRHLPPDQMITLSQQVLEKYLANFITQSSAALDAKSCADLVAVTLNSLPIEQQEQAWSSVLNFVLQFIMEKSDDTSRDSEYRLRLSLFSELNRLSNPPHLQQKYWQTYIRLTRDLSDTGIKSSYLIWELEHYAEEIRATIWLEAWNISIEYIVVEKLPIVYETIIAENPDVFSNIDWSLPIWDHIFTSWDKISAVWNGLARILIHVSPQDAQRLHLKYNSRFEENDWQPYTRIALLPKLSIEQQYETLSLKMMYFIGDIEARADITYLISKWTGSLALDALRISLEKMSDLRANSETRSQYEPFFYENWLCRVAAGMPSEFVVDAWKTVTEYDAWWYGNRDWYKVCLILINRLDKSDKRAIETVWNDIQRLEQERSYSTGGFRDAIAPKLPKSVLQSLVRQMPKAKVTFSDEVFERQLKELFPHKLALFLQRIGGSRRLRKLMEDAYRDSHTWWRDAFIKSEL